MLCEVEIDVEHVEGFERLNLNYPTIYIKAIQTIKHLIDSSLTHHEAVPLQNLTVFTI